MHTHKRACALVRARKSDHLHQVAPFKVAHGRFCSFALPAVPVVKQQCVIAARRIKLRIFQHVLIAASKAMHDHGHPLRLPATAEPGAAQGKPIEALCGEFLKRKRIQLARGEISALDLLRLRIFARIARLMQKVAHHKVRNDEHAKESQRRRAKQNPNPRGHMSLLLQKPPPCHICRPAGSTCPLPLSLFAFQSSFT